MSDEIIRVLYLDDEEPNLFSFKAAFRRDFEVHTCDEPHKAVRMLDEQEFHVVLSDQRMPRISGVEFFELIMPDHPDVSRVLVTGYADTDAVVDAINKGQVYRFVSKPWNEEELRNVIKAGHALNRSRVNSARQGHQSWRPWMGLPPRRSDSRVWLGPQERPGPWAWPMIWARWSPEFGPSVNGSAGGLRRASSAAAD